MPFRTAQNAAEAFALAKNVARGVKALAASNATAFTQTVNRDAVLGLSQNLAGYRAVLASCAATPGVAQYARDQYDDQTYDVVAEFAAMQDAIDAVISNIVSTFPVAPSGGELREKLLNADGTVTYRTFTAAQLSSLVTLLQALDAAISS